MFLSVINTCCLNLQGDIQDIKKCNIELTTRGNKTWKEGGGAATEIYKEVKWECRKPWVKSYSSIMLRNFVPEKETLFQQEFVPKDSSFYNKKHHRRKSEDLNQEFILRYYVKRMQNWRKERLTRGENIIWKTQFMFILLAFIIWSGSSIKGKGEQTRPMIHKHVYRKKCMHCSRHIKWQLYILEP